MVSIENETAKTLDMNELKKHLHFLKLGKSYFPSLECSKFIKSVCCKCCGNMLSQTLVRINRYFCSHKYYV